MGDKYKGTAVMEMCTQGEQTTLTPATSFPEARVN